MPKGKSRGSIRGSGRATANGPRGKPKKRENRYNPNAPDWKAVHAPWSKVVIIPEVSQ